MATDGITYAHIKNLEKYNPGYKDRRHIWAKIYFDSFLDEKIKALDEIDRYRFWSLIVYEIFREGKSVILDPATTALMGWNARKRPISRTMQMLHTLVDFRNVQPESSVPQSRVEESRVEKKYSAEFSNFWKLFKGRWDTDTGGGRYEKGSKFRASEEWKKLSPTEQQKATAKASSAHGKFIQDACRWLKDKRFDD